MLKHARKSGSLVEWANLLTTMICAAMLIIMAMNNCSHASSMTDDREVMERRIAAELERLEARIAEMEAQQD